MTLPDDLRQWADTDAVPLAATCATLHAAADRIEQLEAELARMRGDVVKDGTIGYATGHGPNDPPRPVLERTPLAQEDFDARHP
jgi:hypothetical protein